MNTEQVLKLNQVEKGEYVNPKWWAKEGERLIEITAKSDGNLMVRASLTDDTVLWFSQSKWKDEETLTSVFQVILDTQMEPNAVWHTTELRKILAPLGISMEHLKEGVCRTIRLYPDRIRNWNGSELPRTSDAATILAGQLSHDLMENKEKADGANVVTLMHCMERMGQALKPLADITDPNRVYQAYSQANTLHQELVKIEYVQLSEDSKVREMYGFCEDLYQSVYNHYMSVAR